MENLNLVSKELVKTLSYTNFSEDREVYAEVIIDGRTYYKLGTLQGVTIVGFMYKVFNSELDKNEYYLYCGLSKQHPCDSKINKEIGYEHAATNAQMNPFLIMKVEKTFGNNTFRPMMKAYVDDMDLEFIKTTQEIAKSNKDKSIYNR